MQTNLKHLPDDALDNVAKHLSLASLARFAQASKVLYKVAMSERQFRRRLMLTYGLGLKVRLLLFVTQQRLTCAHPVVDRLPLHVLVE
jgi:hypothetical protein